MSASIAERTGSPPATAGAAAAAGPQIELARIERVFHLGDSVVHALAGIDLSIDAGDYVSVMGPSGSGKSTLLNVLGLLDSPDAGTYRLEGRDVTTLSAAEQARVRSHRIGFVFQSFHLVPRLTAAENIALPMMLAGIPPSERAPRVERALADFGLADRAHHRPDELSGGQRQRVAIARATVMQPAMLLADEPTGNLDRATGDEVIRLLEELNARGVTLILVTHDQALGARAHRRIYMEDGSIRSDTRGSRPLRSPDRYGGESAAAAADRPAPAAPRVPGAPAPGAPPARFRSSATPTDLTAARPEAEARPDSPVPRSGAATRPESQAPRPGAAAARPESAPARPDAAASPPSGTARPPGEAGG